MELVISWMVLLGMDPNVSDQHDVTPALRALLAERDALVAEKQEREASSFFGSHIREAIRVLRAATPPEGQP